MSTSSPSIAPLTQEMLLATVDELCAVDADLARIHAAFGPPPMWHREPGFATLIHIILEQQVSLASALAAFNRLRAVLAEGGATLTPTSFLTLNDETLRSVGFSRQKTRYGRLLAQALIDGALDLDALAAMSDDEACGALTSLKGIGPWTANVYLLMVLRRPDIWPVGDRALVVAAREVKNLPADPTREEMLALGEAWRPWRSVAARLLWHHYLSRSAP